MLLNSIIHFLSDPTQPLSLGLTYVFGMYITCVDCIVTNIIVIIITTSITIIYI